MFDSLKKAAKDLATKHGLVEDLSNNKEVGEACAAGGVLVASAAGGFSTSERTVIIDAMLSIDAISKAFPRDKIGEMIDEFGPKTRSNSGKRELLREIKEVAKLGNPDFNLMVMDVMVDVAEHDDGGGETSAENITPEELEVIRQCGGILNVPPSEYGL